MRSRLAVLVALLAFAPFARSADALPATPEFIWLEGEAPTSTNLKPNLAGWGNKQFLSGEKWLHVSLDAAKVDKELPAEGGLISYAFTAKTAGKYEVWNRIGFEFVRTPFDWRIDGEDWATLTPDVLTTDLMDIDFWCEVAWAKLGDRTLAAGEHKLEIRLAKTKDAKGNTARILYASDALCLTLGAFAPNGPHQPNDPGRDAKDEQAAKQVFALPDPAGADARSSVALEGLWEVCRHDEARPGEVAAPIADRPDQPHWKAIPVPSNKNNSRPDLVFAHRLWYRTRVNVPASCAGRSFYLEFPENNLNTTVVVNGTLCGFNKNPFARFAIDVTKGIKPGVNEVWVGIRDAWYGYSANPNDPMKLRKCFNYPLRITGNGFQNFAYPVWNHMQSGILLTPTLVAAGPAYASDVFVKPSVEKKELVADVTVSNPTAKAVRGEVVCQALNAKTKEVELTLPAQAFTLEPGAAGVTTVTGAWPNAKLWWPDDPNLYVLRAIVKVDGKVIDASDTTFGFRQWTIDGKNFKLNGVVFHGWADCFQADGKDKWLALYRQYHEQMMRFWGRRWQGLAAEEALTFFDQNGVVVRRSGILDGEAIGYNAIENDPDLKKLYNSGVKMDLMKNWQDQVVAQVKGERNHPSVMIWSIENEWLYINCINLYGGMMDEFERVVKQVADAVQAADPTRPVMTDGGAANKDQSMPVCGNHYVAEKYWKYPALAYDANPTGGGRGRWTWDQQRPRFIGEDFYITGNLPELSYFGGEEAFQGKISTRPAASIMARMLQEGYRWAEYGAWHFWMGQNDAPGQYVAYAPRAVFCRQWDWSFGAGQKVKRTFGLFNDTHNDDPITFTWTLTVGGQPVASKSAEYQVHAGTSQKFDVEIEMPKVAARTEGALALTLTVKGAEVFKDVKAVSVLAPEAARAPGAGAGVAAYGLAKLKANDLVVCDPAGGAAAFLKARNIPFRAIADLKALDEKDPGLFLLVGQDALDEAQSTSSRLAAYAASGRRVIVLEQKNPLKYQALPCEMDAATNQGTTAFGEDLNHPALRGLQQKDFFTWGAGELVYRNAYAKPGRGAKSLVQCHDSLQNTALVEVPVGSSVMLVSQLLIEENLADNAVAQQLLLNLIDYAVTYQLEFRRVAVCARGGAQLAKTLNAIGLEFADFTTQGPLPALADPATRKLAVISATPDNLKELAGNLDKLKAFTDAGGWLILHGLTPDGLAYYNQIVGVDHMIRPFRRERVGLPAVRSPLLSGLTLNDIVMYSSERIFPWTEGNYVASDIYSFCVDYEDVAPFAQFPDDFTLNMVNGMVSADGWKYIVNVPAPDSPPLDWVLKFPRPQELVEVEWIGNTFYYPVTKFALFFDGQADKAATFTTQPTNDPQVLAIDPALKGTNLTLRLAEWTKIPGKSQVTGLDNIRLKAKRTPEFYKAVRPLVNVGGMMEYPRAPGNGGIVLCNLLFKDSEDVPANQVKKRNILATILRNLKAPFAGGKSVIAGANLACTPVDLSKQANQFRDDKGWFGDRNFTFKDLPTGSQTFAGVTYNIYAFATSPVPTVVMLDGPGIPNKLAKEVKGIPVNQKADALFFLHTARIDQRMNDREIKDKKRFELARYVVTYADGKTETIPIYSEIDLDHYKQKSPAKAIPGAQIAWTKPYGNGDQVAVAYAKQWNNPRPEVEITSIDVVQGTDAKRGVPALLAVTGVRVK